MVINFLLLAIGLLIFSFIVFRVVIRNDYLNSSKLSPLSYILELIVFALHANLMYFFLPVKWPNLPPFPDNPILRYISLIIFIIGVTILLIAWFGLGSGTSLGQDKNKLKTEGIYKYSRNPQLVGYGLIVLGFAVLYLSAYSIGWFILYLIISYFMIKTEEEFLSMKYTKKYLEYCQITPKTL